MKQNCLGRSRIWWRNSRLPGVVWDVQTGCFAVVFLFSMKAATGSMGCFLQLVRADPEFKFMTRIADFLLERRKRRQLPFDRYLAKNGTAHIIVAGLTHTGFNGFGKVESKIFFPEFCKRLAEYGVSTYFCSTEDEIKKFQKGCMCIINVINEVKKRSRKKLSRFT